MKYINDIKRRKNESGQNLENYKELAIYFEGLLDLIAGKKIEWTTGINVDDVNRDTTSVLNSDDVKNEINKLINLFNNTNYGVKIRGNVDYNGNPIINEGYFTEDNKTILQKLFNNFDYLANYVNLAVNNEFINKNDSGVIKVKDNKYILVINIDVE